MCDSHTSVTECVQMRNYNVELAQKYSSQAHSDAAYASLESSLPHLRGAVVFARSAENENYVKDLQFELKDNFYNQKCAEETPDKIRKLISLIPVGKKLRIPAGEEASMLEEISRQAFKKIKKKDDWRSIITQ